MEKGKVIDMFSRKPMDVIRQDTKQNDEMTSKDGIYAGHIDKELAKIVRDSVASLDAKSDQIDAMVADWEEQATEHFGMLDSILRLLDVDGFHAGTHKLSISEDGHVWVIPID